MRSKAKVPRHGTVISGMLLLAGAQVALAAPPVLHHEGGLLKLHNVRIETASPSQAAGAARKGPVAGQAGLRAFIDPESGELRAQTPEEMMEAATVKAAPSAPVGRPASGRVPPAWHEPLAGTGNIVFPQHSAIFECSTAP